MSRNSLSTPEERGKRAEERFFKAWSDPQNFAAWMVSVDRATKHEDLFQKTDAVIIGISGPNLRIQIKSYFLNTEECIALMEYGVVPLSISAGDSLTKIRLKTHIALQSFKEFNLKKSSFLRKKKNVRYRRRNRKHV
jgi:hypothetical protein